MIRIDRGAAPPLAVYTRESVELKDGKKVSRAAGELALAIEFFTDANNYANDQKLSEKSFAFRVYKDAGLAKALNAAFGGKCAYCESRYQAVTPKDVEHFRPKSEVENKGQRVLRPAYFWLAGDWANLLVSCPDCNRARNHEVPGQPKEVRLGKHTQFPLADEARRVRLHTSDVASEEPFRLLLHPCLDQPEDHLTYDGEALIHPKVQGDARATASIFVYALQRKGLVEERKRTLNELLAKLEMLKSLAVEFNAMDGTTPAATRMGKVGQIKLQMDGICGMFRPGEPYIGMLRDYIRRNLAAGAFNDVADAGMDLARLLA